MIYEAMQESDMLNALKDADSSLSAEMSKPGFANAQFVCKSCGHKFNRRTSTEWLTIRNKIGDERALREYRKLEP